jgi:Kef-type K+ transport system membrane component KefB
MSTFSIITDVLIVLAAALLVGELFERFHLPSVVGEILAGMIIGPSILGLVLPSDPIRARDYFLYAGLAVLIALALGVGVTLTYYISRKVMHSKLDVSPKLLAGILGGRGAIGIVIATVAFTEAGLNESGFSLVILATLIVSLIIPFLAGKKTRRDHEICEEEVSCIVN